MHLRTLLAALLTLAAARLNAQTNSAASTYIPVEVTIVYPFQLCPAKHVVVPGLNVNLIYGQTEAVYGIEVGAINSDETMFGFEQGLSNDVTGNMAGIQIGAFDNVVNRGVYGIQVSPFYNKVDEVFRGIEVGLVNQVGDEVPRWDKVENKVHNAFAGIEAGLINQVAGDVAGLQAGIVINRVGGNAAGLQVSSLFNVVGKDLGGIQTGALLNYVEGDAWGLGVTAGLNYVGGSAGGIQTGIIGNYVDGRCAVLQVTAGANICRNGAAFQVSPLHNRGGESGLSGLQLATWNTAPGGMTGLQIGLLNTDNWDVEVGDCSQSDWGKKTCTSQPGTARTYAGTSNGVLIGGLNISEATRGVEFGVVNVSGDEVDGVQIGAVNIARRLRGVQIGAINVVRESALPFFLGINIGF